MKSSGKINPNNPIPILHSQTKHQMIFSHPRIIHQHTKITPPLHQINTRSLHRGRLPHIRRITIRYPPPLPNKPRSLPTRLSTKTQTRHTPPPLGQPQSNLPPNPPPRTRHQSPNSHILLHHLKTLKKTPPPGKKKLTSPVPPTPRLAHPPLRSLHPRTPTYPHSPRTWQSPLESRWPWGARAPRTPAYPHSPRTWQSPLESRWPWGARAPRTPAYPHSPRTW